MLARKFSSLGVSRWPRPCRGQEHDARRPSRLAHAVLVRRIAERRAHAPSSGRRCSPSQLVQPAAADDADGPAGAHAATLQRPRVAAWPRGHHAHAREPCGSADRGREGHLDVSCPVSPVRPAGDAITGLQHQHVLDASRPAPRETGRAWSSGGWRSSGRASLGAAIRASARSGHAGRLRRRAASEYGNTCRYENGSASTQVERGVEVGVAVSPGRPTMASAPRPTPAGMAAARRSITRAVHRDRVRPPHATEDAIAPALRAARGSAARSPAAARQAPGSALREVRGQHGRQPEPAQATAPAPERRSSAARLERGVRSAPQCPRSTPVSDDLRMPRLPPAGALPPRSPRPAGCDWRRGARTARCRRRTDAAQPSWILTKARERPSTRPSPASRGIDPRRRDVARPRTAASPRFVRLSSVVTRSGSRGFVGVADDQVHAAERRHVGGIRLAPSSRSPPPARLDRRSSRRIAWRSGKLGARRDRARVDDHDVRAAPPNGPSGSRRSSRRALQLDCVSTWFSAAARAWRTRPVGAGRHATARLLAAVRRRRRCPRPCSTARSW